MIKINTNRNNLNYKFNIIKNLELMLVLMYICNGIMHMILYTAVNLWSLAVDQIELI